MVPSPGTAAVLLSCMEVHQRVLVQLRPLGLGLPAHAGSSPLLPNFIPSCAWTDRRQLSGTLQAAQMVSAETS